LAKKALQRLLLADIGNSGIDCAVVVNEKITTFFNASLNVRFAELVEKAGETPEKLVLASVNPPVSERLLRDAAKSGIEVMVAGKDFAIPIKCGLNRPNEVGADRLLVALAAHRRFGASLVVDCGTATTFDLVSAEGVYLGGAITVGLGIAADALAKRCALLPPSISPKPNPPLIGKTTEEALSSGLLQGFAAMIDGMVQRFRQTVDFEFCPVMTGGSSALLFPLCKNIADFIPHLVLEGLFFAFRG